MLQCDRAVEGAEMVPAAILWNRNATLQCDRAVEGAEMGLTGPASTTETLLQCDRAVEGAEIHRKPADSLPAFPASM